MSNAISMVEGTTRFINVDVLNNDETRMNLEGYVAYLSLVCDDNLVIRRTCEISDNVVSTKILPTDTLGKAGHSMRYEIRLIDNETLTVLAIQSGKIKVTPSIDPIIVEDVEEIIGECDK